VLAYFGEDIDASIALIDRALALNPSCARGWFRSGWLRLWAGQLDLAIQHCETSSRLSPREHRSNPFLAIGVAHFFAKRYEEAKTMLLQSLDERPTWAPTYRFLAACYAHMGRLDEAREVVTPCARQNLGRRSEVVPRFLDLWNQAPTPAKAARALLRGTPVGSSGKGTPC
jgi:tetratricopeptide (TPR) repeat protein